MGGLPIGVSAEPVESPGSAPRVRLEYLDGIRGVAALYVSLYHIRLQVEFPSFNNLSAPLRAVSSLLRYGHFSVAVFIVLSGYCLMLPVVRSAGGQLQGGVAGFIRRRAWRILPPYYAALGLSLLLIALTPALREPHGAYSAYWAIHLPAFSPDVIVSHLFLVHNASDRWVYKINGPLWSVATEWQIYFVFALILLPCWRRYGLLRILLPVCAIFALPYCRAGFGLFCTACPWYVALFAMGMAAAEVNFSRNPAVLPWRRLRWDLMAPAAILAALVIHICSSRFHGISDVVAGDVCLGAAMACFLILCTRDLIENPADPTRHVRRIFESPAAVTLGAFSYSFYLLHHSIQSWLYMYWRAAPLSLSPSAAFTAMLLIGTPICLLLSWLFHLVFERPFMPSQRPHPRPNS